MRRKEREGGERERGGVEEKGGKGGSTERERGGKREEKERGGITEGGRGEGERRYNSERGGREMGEV